MNNKQLKEIGEFGFIEKISRMVKTGPSVIKGIGDDCAVLRYKKNKHLLFATDIIIEDIHFMKKASPEAIGHKALAVNLSDIAACGGIPKWAVVSAGLPKDITFNYANRIFKGMSALSEKFNMDIVGGDTSLSKKIVISLAVIGETAKKKLVLRSGAKAKDIIVVTGPLKKRPDHLKFLPKIKESQFIVENLKPNSMIDISDGFLADLKHILKASGKGAIIYESLIPAKGGAENISTILRTGEQFELLFTMDARLIKKLPKGFYPVGEIRSAKGITYINKEGKRKNIEPEGYSHF